MAIDIAYKASVDIGDGTKSLKSLKQEFKDAQKELDGLTTGSEKYIATLKKLGTIRDDIGDLNAEINAFNPEGKVQAFGNVISGVASGFQAATGAMALFGGENKELEKQLLKVQAVMAFTEGIKGVIAMGDSFATLTKVLKSTTLGTYLVTAAQYAYNLALALNPIGLLIAGLAALVVGIKLFTDSSNSAANVQLRMNALEREHTRIVEEEIVALREKQKVNDKLLQHNIEVAKIQGKSITEVRDLERKAVQDKFDELKAVEATRGKLTSKELAEKVDLIRKLEIIDLNYLKASADQRQKDADKKKQEGEKYLAEAKKQAAFLKTLSDKAAQEQRENDAKELENTLSLLQKVAKLKEDESIRLAANDQEVLDIKLAKDLAEIESEYAKTNLGAEAYQSKIDAQLLIESKYYDDINTLRTNDALTAEEKKKKDLEDTKKLNQAKFDEDVKLAQATNQSLQGLSDIFFAVKSRNLKKGSKEELEMAKKQFNINKALSLSAAIVSGIQAVQNSLAVSPLTILGVPNPGAIAALIATGVTSAANVAKIAASKFQESGTGGGGAGSIPSITAPSTGDAPTINAPSSGSTMLNPDGTVNNQQGNNGSLRAFVVETDISTSQRRVNSLEVASHL